MKITTDLANNLAAAYKAALDGGFLYIYSGPVPDSAEDALDMLNEHTELVLVSESGDGITGLTWEAPSNGVLVKNPGETWEGLNSFDGWNAASTQTATFARMCPQGDNGRGAVTTPRVQFLVSGPTGNGEVVLSSTSITDNGMLKTRVDFARIAQGMG